jgi:hypothetical protein
MVGSELMGEEARNSTTSRHPSLYPSIILTSQPNGPSIYHQCYHWDQTKTKTGIARKQNNCTPSHDRRPVGTMILSYTFRALDTTKSSLLPVAEIGIEVKHQAMQEGLECSRTIFVSPWALERRHGSKPQVNPERMITQNAGREVRVCK